MSASSLNVNTGHFQQCISCLLNVYGIMLIFLVFILIRSWWQLRETGWSHESNPISPLQTDSWFIISKPTSKRQSATWEGWFAAILRKYPCLWHILECFAHVSFLVSADRISFSCLFPASWHFSLSSQVVPRLLLPSLRQLLFISLVLCLMGLLYLLLVTGKGQASWIRKENHFHR